MKIILWVIICVLGLVFFIGVVVVFNLDEKFMVDVVDCCIFDVMVLLEKSVNINSGIMNFVGVKKVVDLLVLEFKVLGFKVWFEDGKEFNCVGYLIVKYEGG